MAMTALAHSATAPPIAQVQRSRFIAAGLDVLDELPQDFTGCHADEDTVALACSIQNPISSSPKSPPYEASAAGPVGRDGTLRSDGYWLHHHQCAVTIPTVGRTAL